MNKDFETLKGTYEYLPAEQTLREEIKRKLTDVFKIYGFSPVETPILCMYDLLASKYSADADILNETYKLSDQGERALGLRYDLTICFSKLIATNGSIVMPFKRYEIGKVFRDGPVKLGRNREFTQCDVDIVGVKSIMQDAEFMNLTHDGFKNLGLDIEIRYNNRKLLTGLIKKIFGELDENTTRKAIMLIDKLDKLTNEELKAEFKKIDFDGEKVDELLEVLSLSFEEIKEKFEEDAEGILKEGIDELGELVLYTKNTAASEDMVFSPYLARGIDIYTGTVWEIFLKERNVKGHDFNVSLGGGGRYDHIITEFVGTGEEYPAIGMSFGLDVIYEILNKMHEGEVNSCVDLFIIPIGTGVDSFKLASGLRNEGLKVEIEKMDRRVKKSMNYANKENIPFVIVIGEDEVKNGKIKLKDMQSGDEHEFGIGDYVSMKKIIENK